MNISFINIEIEGFQSIGHASLNLDDVGTIIIKGNNEYESKSESNGSGKSSIAEALMWNLYGSTSTGVTNPVNKYTSTGCLVSTIFKLDNEEYKVTRTCDHHKYKNSLTIMHGDSDISGRNKSDSDKILKDILPMTEDIFLSTTFLSQGFNARLSTLSPSARKSRLEELTQTSAQLDKLKDFLSNSIMKWRTDYSDLSNKLSVSRGQVDILSSEINRLNQVIDEYASMKDPDIDLDAYRSKLNNLNDKILDVTNKKSSAQQKLMEYKSAKTQNQQRIRNASSRITEISSMIESLENKICPTCGQHYESSESESLIDSLNKEMNELTESSQSLEDSISEMDHRMSETNESLVDYHSRIDKFQAAARSIKKIIEDNPEKPKRDINADKRLLIEHSCKVSELRSSQNDLAKQVDNAEVHIKATEHLQYIASRQFRGYLLSNAIDFINQKLAEYSSDLFSEDIIRLSDDTNKLDIYLGDTRYESLSGGEKRKVDLAVTFAQRDLASCISNTSSNLIILDETLEHLDETATHAALQLLSTATTDLSSVFIITHNNYGIPYDGIWTVTKDSNRVSTISEN